MKIAAMKPFEFYVRILARTSTRGMSDAVEHLDYHTRGLMQDSVDTRLCDFSMLQCIFLFPLPMQYTP